MKATLPGKDAIEPASTGVLMLAATIHRLGQVMPAIVMHPLTQGHPGPGSGTSRAR